MAKKIALEKRSAYARYINYTLYLLIVVFLLFAGLYGYMSYTNKKAERLYNSGIQILSEALEQKDLDSKKLDKAVVVFKELIKKYPISKYHKLSMSFLGYVYFLKGDYSKAVRFYNLFKEKSVRSSVEYTSLVNLAVSSCFEEKKELDRAIKVLERFAGEHPESPFREFALLSLERLYRLDNNPNKAKKVIEKFVKEYPRSPFFYMAKARLLSYNNIK